MEFLPVSPYPGSERKPCSTQNNGNPRNSCVICSKNELHSSVEIIPDKPQSEYDIFPSIKISHDNYSPNGTYFSLYSANNAALSTKNANFGKQCDSENHQDLGTKDDVELHRQRIMKIRGFLEMDENNYREFLLSEEILRTKILLMGKYK